MAHPLRTKANGPRMTADFFSFAMRMGFAYHRVHGVSQSFSLLPCGWFQRPPPFGVLPLDEEGELQLLHIKIIKTLCLRVSAFCNKKNPCYLRYLRMKNGIPNYVLPRCFVTTFLCMTKGNLNKTLWNSVYSVVKKVKKESALSASSADEKSEIRNQKSEIKS